MEKGAEVSAKYITKKCNFYPLYFAKNAFFLYVFCRNLYAFSVAFCPKCNFWPLYFAQNAFFWYVFCRNPYSFLHCRLPQIPFFLLYFSKTTILFSCVFCLNFSNLFSIVSYPKCIFSPLYFAQNAVFPVHSAESTASSPASAHRSPQSDSVYPRKPK